MNLYLRSNNIDDAMVEQIAKKVKTSTTLLALDLSKNNLTKKSVVALCEALDRNRSLQYLGLQMNSLIGSDVEGFVNVLGNEPFAPENVEEQLKKMKDRDAIIEKNKKLKGKKEEPVPYVENIVQVDTKWILQKNLELKMLNLDLNKFDDSIKDFIDKLLSKTTDAFKLSIGSKKISKDLIKALTTKYNARLIIQ